MNRNAIPAASANWSNNELCDPAIRTRSDRRRQQRASAHRRRVSIVAGVALLGVVGLSVVGYEIFADGGAPRATVSGSFLLVDSTTAASNCYGQNGYNDIEPGTTVILTDQSGKILGSSALSSGHADQESGTCLYHFSMTNVPENAAQYAVEVSHRGKVVDSLNKLKSSKWKFFVTLGE